jgi:hypothetical protein
LKGRRRFTDANGNITYEPFNEVWLSVGPPTGYLQKKIGTSSTFI